MTNILALLREKGYKITPQRRAVIEALFNCGKFPTAQQIMEYVRNTQPEMGLDTIYRNLNILTDIGVIQQINIRGRDSNVFELVEHHHHHLVCLSCGDTRCLDYCPVHDNELQQAATTQDFNIVSHSLELYGYCRNCRAN